MCNKGEFWVKDDKKKKTVGAHSYDLMLKNDKIDHSAQEQASEQLNDYEKGIQECYQRGAKKYHDRFFIVVLTKKERLMQNVLRHYFFPRHSCPTPKYDQAVYIADPQSGTIQFLWVVPAKDVCYYLRDNALNVNKEQKDLLSFVLDFFDNTLLNKAKTLNGEIIKGNAI